MIEPGSVLGVLGGGQLARMFALAAQRLGYRVAVLDPAPDCPAAGVADAHLCAPLDNADAWESMARLCSAVTVESENVPAEALQEISRHVPVAPDARALEIAQNRIREKAFLASWGIPVAENRVLQCARDLNPELDVLLPGILKASRWGYDGKGQRLVATRKEVGEAFEAFGGAPCVLEALQPLAAEISVILARDPRGSLALFPIPMNRHRGGILDLSVAPAPLPDSQQEMAQAIALEIARRLDYRGVLCVEFFALQDGTLVVNEIAPRPHNSGHFTIEACETSQFEQQVRVLAGLPLGATRQHRPAAMANLLGDLWCQGTPLRWDRVLATPGARLHLYGKRRASVGRKMGHITCLADSAHQAALDAARLRQDLVEPALPAASPSPQVLPLLELPE